ncbi:hypothetical protein FB558_0609 [Pseudonocardia kunmingensis]|uniref:Uncharacterized protein n=1 Tax=Pseudonocardia kunmingensis TaxID=630975 RepID=A0A543DX12_9PSEU|nr:hypothetical protein FB558_0609 [Pseudonocardia kunmingensis]
MNQRRAVAGHRELHELGFETPVHMADLST